MNQTLHATDLQDIEDIQLISHYPITYAREAFVLLRRLAFLKLMMQNVPPSQSEAFDDTKDFEDVVTNLIKSKGMTVAEYVKTYHPYISIEEVLEVEEDEWPMTQKIDKNKIRDSVLKARQQDLLYVTVNPTEKDSKKNALAEIDKFIGKGSHEIVLLKK